MYCTVVVRTTPVFRPATAIRARGSTARSSAPSRPWLSHLAGADTFLRLAETADVVIDSVRPGVLERLGVGWDAPAGAQLWAGAGSGPRC
ncbi:MAG: CoA transferase [Mycobacterium sp.]